MIEKNLSKEKIKVILMTLKTEANEEYIKILSEKIDKLDDKKIETILKDVGYTEEAVKKVLEEKINKMLNQTRMEKHLPLNKLFTYGITGSTIHLHLPGNLFKITGEKSPSKAQDKVNLYLIDALEKIKEMKQNGDSRIKGVKNIYMISRLLSREDERKLLFDLGFDTKIHTSDDLKNKEYIEKNPESRLAIHLFGDIKSVGSAIMPLDKVYEKDWEVKKEEVKKNIKSTGISLDDDSEQR